MASYYDNYRTRTARRRRLSQDYNSLIDIASEYGVDYNALRAANRGRTVYTRGSYINLPETTAAATTDTAGVQALPLPPIYVPPPQNPVEPAPAPTPAPVPTPSPLPPIYTPPPQTTPTPAAPTPAPVPSRPVTGTLPPYTPPAVDPRAPLGFSLPATQRFRGRAGYQNMIPSYVPPIPESFDSYRLPREQYQYFYGENPQRQAERNNAARRMQELERVQAERAAAARVAEFQAQREATTQAREQAQSQYGRRFQQGQYGDRFARASQRTTPRTVWNSIKGQWENAFQNEWMQEQQRSFDQFGRYLRGVDTRGEYVPGVPGMRIPQTTREKTRLENMTPAERYRYGGVNVVTPGLTEQLQQNAQTRGSGGTMQATQPEQKPYTTDWLQRWMDATDPDTISAEDLYMLQVVGAVEPTAEVTQTPYTGGGYGGYYPYYGGGGYGGYGGYNYPSYGGGNYYPGSEGAGLVKWRI